MLKRFTVENFKNFKEPVTLDFTKTRDYDWNRHLIKDGYVNKALLYGRNGSGKSNLGFAILDIATHLSNNLMNPLYYLNALNGDGASEEIRFVYEFDFNGDDVIYSYVKDGLLKLKQEKIVKNGKIVFDYDFETNRLDSSLPEVSTLNPDLFARRDLDNSIVKVVYGYASSFAESSPIKNIVEFAFGLLWFRSLNNFEFMGNTNAIENIDRFVAEDEGRLKDFSHFLSSCGLSYDLTSAVGQDGPHVYAKFHNRSLPLFQIASTGTRSLWLFYYWTHRVNRISFLYLDEFDAFYHHDLAYKILSMVNSDDTFQSVITTHNAFLADNSIMRPDCYLNLKDGIVKSFADSTNRTIRQGNNLSKMVFSEDL